MNDRRLRWGRLGEDLAAAELVRRGYLICDRNWRCAAGEVDIVAKHDNWLVFVEVRTRRGKNLGTPEASVTPTKRARLIEVAQHFLSDAELGDVDWRIDVVAVELTFSGSPLRIDVYENAVTG